MKNMSLMLLLVFFCTTVNIKANSVAAPEFEEEPVWPEQTYYDEDGPTIVLNCKITEVPYTLLWFKDGESLNPSKEQLLLENGNQSLRFEVPKEFQSGLYRCLAYNAAGNVSHSGNIVITARKQETRPRVVGTEPVSAVVHAKIGDTVNISCTFDVGGSVEALMDLSLDWLKDGVLLEDSNHTVYGLQTLDNNNKVSLLNILDLKDIDYGIYKCFGENSKGNDSRLVAVLPPEPHQHVIPLYLIVGCSAGGLVAMVTLVACIVLRRRYLTSMKYEQLEWPSPDASQFEVPDRRLEFDVFISYSSDDLTWVKDILFQKLVDQGYQVCIDFKDFTPGNDVAENIMDAVYKSRKTIVLLSKSFLRSMWGQFELQQAHNRAVMQRSDVLIIIKYDNSKVPGKLLGKTFLDWSDTKVKPHFWSRLNEAIGEPGSFHELNIETSEPGSVQEPEAEISALEQDSKTSVPITDSDMTDDKLNEQDNESCKMTEISRMNRQNCDSEDVRSRGKLDASDKEQFTQTIDGNFQNVELCV